MRPLEIVLIVLTVSAAVCLLIGRWRQIGRLLMAGSLLVAVAHGIFEGAHWQMIPAYVATGILCVVAWMSDGEKRGFRIITALSVLLLAAASVLFSFLLPMFRLPRPTGPYSVGTTTLYLKDSTRIEDAAPVAGSARELMVQLWYPAQSPSGHRAIYREPKETRFVNSYQSQVLTNSYQDAPIASAGAPFPVVLFNPGWHGRRTQNTFLTEELASYGYVVASIDHTYNSGLVVFPDGRVIRGTPPADIPHPEISTSERVRAIWDKELLKWAADQRFVLDRLEVMNAMAGTPWYGRLNTHLAAAVGHSFGGAASVQACAEDTRIRGAVNMDGWYFGAIRARGPNQPLLALGAGTPDDLTAAARPNPNPTVDEVLDAADSADIEASLSRFGGYRVLVRGVNHEDFTDQPLLSPLRRVAQRGSLPASRIQNIVRTYVLAFLDKTLRGEDPWILRMNSSPYSEVSIKDWPAAKSESAPSTTSKSVPNR
jgi:dienelactone hydrolase